MTMTDKTTNMNDTYYGNFFATFCIIFPNGMRWITPHYCQYRNSMLWHAPRKHLQFLKFSYAQAEVAAATTEESFSLPEGYLSGVSEIYDSPLKISYLAALEKQRLKKMPEKIGTPAPPQEHLDLVLTTSLSLSQNPHFDITRVVVTEERTDCNCLFCVEGMNMPPEAIVGPDEAQAISSFLQINPRLFNIYLPFRRLGQLGNESPPLRQASPSLERNLETHL